jgi:hypothetical protein
MILTIVTLAIALDPATFYAPVVEQHAKPTATDFYTPPVVTPLATEVPQKEEETCDVQISRRRVNVYLDLRDPARMRRVIDEYDRVQGLEFVFKDKDEVPEAGKQFALPLLHFSTGDGRWGFRSGWSGPTEFAAYWRSQNPDQYLQVGKSQARSANQRARYRAVSYEWKLIGYNNDANALRNHLAAPSEEHHGAYFDRAWLAELNLTELQGLHSDAHNNRVQWQYVHKTFAAASSTEVAAAKAPVTKEEKQLGRVIYGTRDGKHPGPVGASIRKAFGDPRYQYYSCPNGNCPWTR